MTGIDKLLENYKESLSGDEDTGKFNELNKSWEEFKAAFLVNKQLSADQAKTKEAAESLQALSTAFGKAQKRWRRWSLLTKKAESWLILRIITCIKKRHDLANCTRNNDRLYVSCLLHAR